MDDNYTKKEFLHFPEMKEEHEMHKFLEKVEEQMVLINYYGGGVTESENMAKEIAKRLNTLYDNQVGELNLYFQRV